MSREDGRTWVCVRNVAPALESSQPSGTTGGSPGHTAARRNKLLPAAESAPIPMAEKLKPRVDVDAGCGCVSGLTVTVTVWVGRQEFRNPRARRGAGQAAEPTAAGWLRFGGESQSPFTRGTTVGGQEQLERLLF